MNAFNGRSWAFLCRVIGQANLHVARSFNPHLSHDAFQAKCKTETSDGNHHPSNGFLIKRTALTKLRSFAQCWTTDILHSVLDILGDPVEAASCLLHPILDSGSLTWFHANQALLMYSYWDCSVCSRLTGTDQGHIVHSAIPRLFNWHLASALLRASLSSLIISSSDCPSFNLRSAILRRRGILSKT